MAKDDLDRREFHKLTAAALGGLVAGSLAGCQPADQGGATTPVAPTAAEGAAMGDAASGEPAADKHVCRGLNACKGQGADGQNSCAGQGSCATAAAHSCHGHNECKGQGGCGESAGSNSCKGQGECAVPLSDSTWTRVRAAFEARMKGEGKEVGAAPAAS
jgi:hypothetical protein